MLQEDCINLHIIKVDLLGLGMMAALKDCLELIPQHYGGKVDLAQLPEDEDVCQTLQQADTVGMFQVESGAHMASSPEQTQKKLCRRRTGSHHLYKRECLLVTRSKFLMTEGRLQNQDGVIHVKAPAPHGSRRQCSRTSLARFPLNFSIPSRPTTEPPRPHHIIFLLPETKGKASKNC